jgi:hypothetical protein
VRPLIGLFLWSAFLGALITNEGQTFETPALLVYFAFALVLAAAVWLWKAAHGFAWPDGDPDMAFAWALMVVWFGALALLAIWVVLRLTDVVGPLNHRSRPLTQHRRSARMTSQLILAAAGSAPSRPRSRTSASSPGCPRS